MLGFITHWYCQVGDFINIDSQCITNIPLQKHMCIYKNDIPTYIMKNNAIDLEVNFKTTQISKKKCVGKCVGSSLDDKKYRILDKNRRLL